MVEVPDAPAATGRDRASSGTAYYWYLWAGKLVIAELSG